MRMPLAAVVLAVALAAHALPAQAQRAKKMSADAGLRVQVDKSKVDL
jgi:hypothetical protein